MKTLNLARKTVSLEDLLKLASVGSVRILAADGNAFVLEADNFEKEVRSLGKSKKFRRFFGGTFKGAFDNVVGRFYSFPCLIK